VTNEQKRKVIADYLDATIKMDIEWIGSFLTEDFTIWFVPSARQHGLPIPLVGRQRFMDFVRELQGRPGMWQPRSFTPQQFLFDADSVAVRVRLVGEFPSGLAYDNEYVFIYRFAGDKIAEMREFTDAAYIASLVQQAAAHAG
jgi:ketosteroid isomerase-like protein